MTILVLVRHGVTDATGKRLYGRSEGVHLSTEGRAEAERVAARLSALRLAALYSSPLDRCVETADAIATRCGLDVSTLDELLEVDYGTLTGRTFPALQRTKVWRRLHRAPSTVRFPEGETLLDVQRRHVETMERLAAAHPGSVVAVVSHGDPICLTLAHYGGVHVDLFQRLAVAPGSISAIAIGDGDPKILRVNDTGSVDDLAPRGPGRRRG